MQEECSRRLAAYKQAIDADIAAYADHIRQSTGQQYGPHAGAVTGAYLDMLQHGGKRIRGALAMVGYEMCGGQDRAVILRAATALEMLHAYMLIVDDIQDRSKVRRGKPTVHEALADYHRKLGLRGDADHTGLSLALDAALTGAHAAQTLLAGLSVDPELRIKAIGIINYTLIITAHGQTTDIMNELVERPDATSVFNALEWKTAHYTILNPLCVGMVLAGAQCDDTDAIRDYALAVGRAFQVTDDIIGVFGNDAETGKSNMDDIREGKQTILTLHAFEHLSPDDAAFLRSCLGNSALTTADFQKARELMQSCGAVEYARQTARQSIQEAHQTLDREGHRWPVESVNFLRGLADLLLSRSQ
jgi:geranylgeranyl diphosphate synthase type I